MEQWKEYLQSQGLKSKENDVMKIKETPAKMDLDNMSMEQLTLLAQKQCDKEYVRHWKEYLQRQPLYQLVGPLPTNAMDKLR